ncbi:MAG: aminopeptidase N [Deltaproteobacteria bacterium]|nr:MAG: aminopeptidase N [Deltaproteobacteria bacterium]
MSELQTVYLKDYAPPAYLVDHVELHVELEPAATRVRAKLQLHANPAAGPPAGRLHLDGRGLELLAIALDDTPLAPSAYAVDTEGVTIAGVPERFSLETLVRIDPAGNTALEGLYRAGGIFCTQCEAQGFRKITFYPDRPDVMARFTVTLAGDRELCPVLLANGNLTASGPLDGNRHFATFNDPFPKPAYLFAMVAGPLVAIEDRFVTASGREVRLQIFVEERNRDKCGHAMASLKHAMRWDEESFGLECDLDEYKIVAVDDFNMGAMENKGLNVFNSRYVLADPDTATDADFQGVEAVIGHEYFHNWTGNRVTCRDWFQLSLKEGLTVFRDQEFSADMGSRAVKRIADVRLLRNGQFPEDAGPMAHPVRPESYVEINNFYTATVYNKGAEVIRMYRTLLGADGFRRGLRLYLERFDGQAVTTDDFLAAMAEANAADLSQFRRWYSQAGTPVLDVSGRYDAAERAYTLQVRQSCPPTPGQPVKEPFLIPLAVGLLGPDGRDLPLQLAGETGPGAGTRVLRVAADEQSFRFVNVPVPPVPSLLRDFSAPVRLEFPCGDAELAFLFAHDSDPFSRWEAGQRLAGRVLLTMIADLQAGRAPQVPAVFLAAFRAALTDAAADPAFLALALTLPGEIELAEAMTVADPGAVHAARQHLRRMLAAELAGEFRAVMAGLHAAGPYRPSAAAIGRRSLKNLCLSYLTLLETPDVAACCLAQFEGADNMTDRLAALVCLANGAMPQRELALAEFYRRYQAEPLVVDKWFAAQAASPRADTLAQVQELLRHPAFTLKNPNRVRALIGTFAHGNPARFHDPSGDGYRFVADRVIELDPLNPQVAARLVAALSRWQRFDAARQGRMRAELERIRQRPELSRDVAEIVGKSLGSVF